MGKLLQLLVAGFKRGWMEIVAGLGISVVSFTGVELVFQKIIVNIQNSMDSLPSATLQLLYLSGGFTALNIILTAAFMRLTMDSVGRLNFKGKK